MDVDLDVSFWSQQLSFILVGVIILCSIRGLLIQLMKIFRTFSSSLSPNHIILLLSQTMGMYFISSVLMIRSSVPIQYRTLLTEVLPRLEFHFYHRWFDVIFLISAISSIGFLYGLNQVARQKEKERVYWSIPNF